jgi:hypothetical protein
MRLLFISLPFLFFLSCTASKNTVQSNEAPPHAIRDTSSGQKEVGLIRDSIVMPLTGIAQNQKGGAVIVVDGVTYWIDGLMSWEDRYAGHPVRVWGEVIVRNDNPVFLDTGVVISQGIPVESEKNLRANQQRFWILNARYELLRP